MSKKDKKELALETSLIQMLGKAFVGYSKDTKDALKALEGAFPYIKVNNRAETKLLSDHVYGHLIRHQLTDDILPIAVWANHKEQQLNKELALARKRAGETNPNIRITEDYEASAKLAFLTNVKYYVETRSKMKGVLHMTSSDYVEGKPITGISDKQLADITNVRKNKELVNGL